MMDARSAFMNPSTQQQYKSMFGNQFSNIQDHPQKQLMRGENSSVLDSNASDKNQSGTYKQNRCMAHHPYQTAQFKQGFSHIRQSEPSEILTITIEIGPDQNETISIREGDDP